MNPQTNNCGRFTRRNQVMLAAFGLIFSALVGNAASEPVAAVEPAPQLSSGFQPRNNISVYQPIVPRDPFTKPGTNSQKISGPTMFHIDGLFGSTKKMTAIVNGSAISLNKPAFLETASGRTQVKAVKITFDEVVLEVGGQCVELKRATENQPAKPPS